MCPHNEQGFEYDPDEARTSTEVHTDKESVFNFKIPACTCRQRIIPGTQLWFLKKFSLATF